jgi:hypothetical protein
MYTLKYRWCGDSRERIKEFSEKRDLDNFVNSMQGLIVVEDENINS